MGKSEFVGKTSVPVALRERYREITALTDSASDACLNEEYRELCREMTAAICRKKVSPILTGKAQTWACGIVFTIARINFLFEDPDNPRVTRDELSAQFDMKARTGSEKASAIMKLLKAVDGDPQWWRPSRMSNNPRIWYLRIDGMIVPADSLTIEEQEEAVRRGIIPCMPSERTGYQNWKVEQELLGQGFRTLFNQILKARKVT